MTTPDPLSRAQGIDTTRPPSVVTLFDALIDEAVTARASDIHIDPNTDGVRIRTRIDGVVGDRYQLPASIHPELIARVKILAGLRTDEHQSPQDGRFRRTSKNGSALDVRVSVMPTYHGENAVLRLLVDSGASRELSTLGISAADASRISDLMRKRTGLVLATGPTGSGKTTTLYSLIAQLDASASSIVTIEDPIEYDINDVRQIAVKERAGLTFGSGLRSILRQDPDVIMVGEIRDEETATLAVQAALTGHLVLSSLHTTNAATSILRLLDMGIEPFLLASTLRFVIGQRLVRRICPSCKTTFESETPIERLRHTAYASHTTWHKGSGCEHCSGTGYYGRLCMYELMVIDEDIRHAITKMKTAADIEAIAVAHGMRTMEDDGLSKAAHGETTLEEILRELHD